MFFFQIPGILPCRSRQGGCCRAWSKPFWCQFKRSLTFPAHSRIDLSSFFSFRFYLRTLVAELFYCCNLLHSLGRYSSRDHNRPDTVNDKMQMIRLRMIIRIQIQWRHGVRPDHNSCCSQNTLALASYFHLQSRGRVCLQMLIQIKGSQSKLWSSNSKKSLY